MSDKSTILRTFNKHFFEFIEDVVRIFPDNMDVKNSKTSFELIKMGNPTAIIKAWHIFVYTPYSNVIKEGDITFFFEKDYSSDLNHLANSNEIMKIIDTIRGPVKNMNEKERDFTMKYIQNLSKLSDIYNSM
jgi:hypothetical protein